MIPIGSPEWFQPSHILFWNYHFIFHLFSFVWWCLRKVSEFSSATWKIRKTIEELVGNLIKNHRLKYVKRHLNLELTGRPKIERSRRLSQDMSKLCVTGVRFVCVMGICWMMLNSKLRQSLSTEDQAANIYVLKLKL